MKTRILTALTTIAIAGFISTSTAFAEETSAPATAQQEEHHADAKKSDAKAGHEKMGMDMDMEKMHKMKTECMKNHKDGKMCDHMAMGMHGKNMEKMKAMKKMKHEEKKSEETK